MKQQKLRASMLLMELMFLLIVVGGSVLLYNMFAPAYYRQQKSRVIEKAYEEVKRMDLSAIGDEEMETLKSYEGQNLTFTIAVHVATVLRIIYIRMKDRCIAILLYTANFLKKIQKYSSGMQEEKKHYGYLEG